MKEFIVELGGRHVYATEIRDMQAEQLDTLQGFFSQMGALIISGCVVTSNVGTPANWDISEGIVGILHADGYKVARFAGATNVSFPGYLTISKATITGDYGEPGSITVKTKAYDYTAVWNTGTPGANDDTNLEFPDPPGQPKRLVNGLAILTNTVQQDFNVNLTEADATISIIVNRAARQVYVRGTVEFQNVGSWADDVLSITLVDAATLYANAVIGSDIDLLGSGFWQAHALPASGDYPVDVNSERIATVNMSLISGNLVVNGRKTGGTGYSVYFNAVLPMLF